MNKDTEITLQLPEQFCLKVLAYFVGAESKLYTEPPMAAELSNIGFSLLQRLMIWVSVSKRVLRVFHCTASKAHHVGYPILLSLLSYMIDLFGFDGRKDGEKDAGFDPGVLS